MFTFRHRTLLLACAGLFGVSASALAATLEVPRDQKTIQAGIDAAQAGDTVVVSAGTYRERIRLKPGVTVQSAGDNAKGELGLQRAEATIIDGSVTGATGSGVAMAEGSTLDGFTVTGVGKYDDALWKKHYATQGEQQSHEHIGVPGTAGIGVIGVTDCTVTNNIVHHIGYTGIAIMGAKDKRVSPHVYRNVTYRNMGGGIGSMQQSTAIIEENVCFENFYAGIGHNNASPLVTGNICYDNIRAGIGISEHSKPIVRGNKCYKNRRAGIGIRTGEQTQPVVEHNECYENDMAGIGNRDDARPIIRQNRCYKNKMAGIGSRDGARALIEGNECFENGMAGIGSRLGAAPVIRNNRCYRNEMAHGNELLRTEGGAPPLVAVKGGSIGVVSHNSIRGGGVAGVLAHGNVQVIGNRFHGKGPGQGSAVWVWKDSTVTVANNRFQGYRNAVNASGSQVTATGNVTREFEGPAIIVKNSSSPAHVYGNTAISDRPQDRAVDVSGSADNANVLVKPNQFDESRHAAVPIWPLLSAEAHGDSFHTLANTGRHVVVQEGPWKLVVTYGKTTTYALFHSEDDPQDKNDLSVRLEQITFRLRGLLEKRENLEYQSEMLGKGPGR